MQLSSIADLEQYITAKIHLRWPEYNLRAIFKPMSDLSHGDVGSDVLIQLSNLTKKSPESLGGELWKLIEPSSLFSLERGFVNFRGPSDASWLLQEEPLPYLPRNVCFFISKAGKSVSFEGYVRLLASTMLHIFEAIRLGCKVT